jgi:hypothetical protein
MSIIPHCTPNYIKTVGEHASPKMPMSQDVVTRAVGHVLAHHTLEKARNLLWQARRRVQMPAEV